jgi:putative ABC transport system ATP-binding protein
MFPISGRPTPKSTPLITRADPVGAAGAALPVVVLDARKTYPAVDAPIRALDGVSLQVRGGEMVALVGPSGCGKSTLLNLVGCVDLPTSGQVRIDGRSTSALDDDALTLLRRDRVGTIFQFFNLLPALTVEVNVGLPLVLQGLPAPEVARRVREALAEVGLADKARAFPAQISGGQLQRAAIARAIVHRPAVLLADEPTGNLDSRSSDEVVQMLRQAVDDWQQTMILVTHDPRVAAYADRIVFLKDGTIVDENRLKGQGKADQIREQLSKVAIS